MCLFSSSLPFFLLAVIVVCTLKKRFYLLLLYKKSHFFVVVLHIRFPISRGALTHFCFFSLSLSFSLAVISSVRKPSLSLSLLTYSFSLSRFTSTLLKLRQTERTFFTTSFSTLLNEQTRMRLFSFSVYVCVRGRYQLS